MNTHNFLNSQITLIKLIIIDILNINPNTEPKTLLEWPIYIIYSNSTTHSWEIKIILKSRS